MSAAARRPRLGFLGTGWIGRHRLEAIVQSGAAEAAAVVDPLDANANAARAIAPDARRLASLDDMLEADLDGVVIATPSALHADQAVAALQGGLAVFCQKPLGRSAAETRRVIEAARLADRRLDVDLSYRHIEGARRIRELILGGGLGQVFAADLTFHNAYGPDKPWFYDPARSGGGCAMDLGIHLVDLLLWTLDFPRVDAVSARLYACGAPLGGRADVTEDYAVAALELDSGLVARLACSWKLPAGCDAVIAAEFYGTRGGAMLRNVGGSFYDFTAIHTQGTHGTTLSEPPDAWGGRAAVAWAGGLATSAAYDEGAERLEPVAETIDRIYGRATREAAV